MRFWFSPFPIEAKLQSLLSGSGVEHDQHAGSVPGELLLLYDAPHSLAYPTHVGITVDALTKSYQRLLELVKEGATAVAIPRLLGSTPQAVRVWLATGGSPTEVPSPADPSSATALLALQVLELRPDLLDAYLDLELHADLLGGSVDSHYLNRLRRVVTTVEPDHLLGDWQNPFIAISQMAERMRILEETLVERDNQITKLESENLSGRLSLEELQLKQEKIQGLLEQCRAENNDHLKQLSALHSERDTLRCSLEEQTRQAKTLKEETQSMAVQIRQAHVELEHTFLISQRGIELGRRCQVQLRRAENLLRRLP